MGRRADTLVELKRRRGALLGGPDAGDSIPGDGSGGRSARRVGAVAQLGERLVRNEEVSGSIPLSSTKDSMTCGRGIDASGTFVSLFVS